MVSTSQSVHRHTAIRYGSCLAALLGFGIVSTAGAAPRTTAPAALTQVKVSITDKAVLIARDKFTQGSLTRYPRGAIIDFLITNRGTKAYRAQLLLTGQHNFTKYENKGTSVTSPAVAPGRKAHLRINFYFRSRFALLALLGGKRHGELARILIF